MASKRMNVLVYSGTGSTLESVRHCLYTLQRLLSPYYAVLTVNGDVLLEQPWQATCALLVFPGGADLGYCRTLNGQGNRLIRQYVNTGGSYLGLCAGGYYASARCEFEVGDPNMEVIGARELEFFPGICRGCAFKGFVYNSEAGTRAADLTVNKEPFSSIGDGRNIPDGIKAYANGGSVFVDAEKFTSRGVEVLASYTEKLEVDSGEGAAAVVYRKVGDGNVVLTGPHPEFAAANLSKKAKGADPSVIEALAADDQPRKHFLKACLLKLGLRISEQDEDPPSLSSIHFSSIDSNTIADVVKAWEQHATISNGESYLKGEVDTFHLEKPSSTWSMSNLVQTIDDIFPKTSSDQDPKADKTHHSNITDPTTLIKRIHPHPTTPPDAKETPTFNHASYFSNLTAYTQASPATPFGTPLLHSTTTTSTSTLLEKNPTLTAPIPTGTTFTATTQLSGRGRGSNVWISPAGSLMFSFLLRHPLSLNEKAPVVFLQYLAAMAATEGVKSYDVEGEVLGAKRGAYREFPVALKWPNDIYALDPVKCPKLTAADRENRGNYTKVGGVLVNTSYAGGDYTVIVGIGLNVNNAAPTTSLNAIVEALNAWRGAGRQLQEFTLEKLLARVMSCFGELYSVFCERGFGGRLQGIYEAGWLHGGQVVVLEEEGGVKARIKGVTGDWGLLRVEEVREASRGGGELEYVGMGRESALQSDSNSFDFFRGLVRRKL